MNYTQITMYLDQADGEEYQYQTMQTATPTTPEATAANLEMQPRPTIQAVPSSSVAYNPNAAIASVPGFDDAPPSHGDYEAEAPPPAYADVTAGEGRYE